MKTLFGLKKLNRREVDKMRRILSLVIVLMFVSSLAFAGTFVDGGKGMVDINDISKGTQTNDVKVTLDSETIELKAGTAEIGKVKITDGTEEANVNASNQLEVNVNTATGLEVVQPTAADLNMTEASAANILTAVQLIDDAIAGSEMQVDIVTLPALVAGSANIGDVDVLSVIPGVTATSLGKAEDAAHTSGDVGVMALTVRQDTAAALGTTDADYQPLITDASGRLHVLDANSGAIKTAVELIDNAITGNEMQVDVITMPSVTVTATDLDIRDLTSASDSVEAVQSVAASLNMTEASASAIKTAVELIDNAIAGTEMQVDVVAPLPAGTNNIGDVDVLTLPALVAGSALIGKVNIDSTLVTKTGTQDLSAGALAYTTNFAADTRIKQVMIHADAAMTQTITVTFDSATGATYDTVLDKTSVTTATDYLWIPDHDFVIASGDEFLIACTNSGTPAVNVYVSVLGETIN